MKLPQPSLSRGELSPGLYGRVDTAAYPTAVATCRNFISKATGGAEKRPGLRFRGFAKTDDERTRILPFIYSTQTTYLIEMGAGYFRFWAHGALLELDGHPVEITNPYSWDDLKDVRFTQSADVLTLVHGNHAPRELRRLSSTSFELREFTFKRGPFRPLNADEAVMVAVSGTSGSITVASNAPIFDAGMVNQLIYLEEKELRGVRPWEPTERNVPLGSLRRSDSKTYRASSVPSIGGLDGRPYYICGNSRPIHEVGRAWDGPGDARTDAVNGYVVGVEWEYVNAGYGVVKLTEYVSPTQMKGVVMLTIPESIVGTVSAPANTWTFSGDGSATVFPITGANSPSGADYAVSVSGTPTQSNPYNEPVTGGGGSGGGSLPGRTGNARDFREER